MGTANLIYLLSILQLHSAEPVFQLLQVTSEVQASFATTTIEGVIANPDRSAAKTLITAEIPPNAFITSFYLDRDGDHVYGSIKEKSAAEAEFQAAVQKGDTAAYIRDSNFNTFELEIQVSAQSEISFNLTYQEVLVKSQSLYKHAIKIIADKPIKEVEVTVMLVDSSQFDIVHVPEMAVGIAELPNDQLLHREADPRADVRNGTGTNGSIAFVDFKAENIDRGELVVLFNNSRSSGEQVIKVVDGYFLHQFTPSEDTPTGKKNVIFVLDKSGSMKGTKMQQLKAAMGKVLDDISDTDLVNILMFDRQVFTWKESMVRLDESTREDAKEFIQKMESHGGTDVGSAMKDALEKLNEAATQDPSFVSMIVFLTDGRATVGEKNDFNLLNLISEYNKDFLIHTISFGNDADYSLLKKISSAHRGLARRIFESADAEIQIEGLYKEIAVPLLKDVKVKYLDEDVDISSLISNNDDDVIFAGTDRITIGKLSGDSDPNSIATEIEAQTDMGPQIVRNEVIPSTPCVDETLLRDAAPLSENTSVLICGKTNTATNFIERMWVHMSLRKYEKLLETSAESEEEKTNVAQRIKRLALKYGLVTSQTSMVVVLDGHEKALSEAEEDLLDDPIPTARRKLLNDELSDLFRPPFVAKQEKYPDECRINLLVIMDRVWSKKINNLRARKFGADIVNVMPSYVTVDTAEIGNNRSITIDYNGEHGLEDLMFKWAANERTLRKEIVLISENASPLLRPLQYLSYLQPALTKLIIINPYHKFTTSDRALLREINEVIVLDRPSPADVASSINCNN